MIIHYVKDVNCLHVKSETVPGHVSNVMSWPNTQCYFVILLEINCFEMYIDLRPPLAPILGAMLAKQITINMPQRNQLVRINCATIIIALPELIPTTAFIHLR